MNVKLSIKYLDFFSILQDFSGYDSNTEDRYQLDISSSQKDYIVKLHNELRNKVALGQIGRLGSASRMPALVCDFYNQHF